MLHLNTLAPRPFVPPRGLKQVFLPNMVLTLLRTPKLPANYASFIVPLSMNKLDIKDYLWNAYGIPVLSVRSFVQQQPVQQMKMGPGRGMQRRWYRPRSLKKMTVEMGAREQGRNGKGGGLFVWPAELKDEELEPWDKQAFEMGEQEQQAQQKTMGVNQQRYERPGKESLAEQARRLREGKEQWRPTWQQLRGKK